MALSTASLKAVDGLSLTAGGVLSTEAGTEKAILSTHGGVILAPGDGISNAGAFSAEGGDLATTSGGFISNTGLVPAQGTRCNGAHGRREGSGGWGERGRQGRRWRCGVT